MQTLEIIGKIVNIGVGIVVILAALFLMVEYSKKYFRPALKSDNISMTDLILIDQQKEREENKRQLKHFFEAMFYISDGVHNIGDIYFKQKSNLKEDEYLRSIGIFFSSTRKLSQNLKDGRIYSNEEFEEIINFIKNDFSDFCHYDRDSLDTKRYWEIVAHPSSENF